MPRARSSPEFRELLGVARRLEFGPHRIAHQLDARGRHELPLPGAFPFQVNRFTLRSGAVTRQLTWHQRLELLMPLDGPMRERIGDRVVALEAGDLLVMDQLKPHQAVDDPGLDTRVVVLTFLQEWVFAPGSPTSDYAFLAPFQRRLDGEPRVLRGGAPEAAEAHRALARLLACYHGPAGSLREAGCKAWLLVVLQALLAAFPDPEVDRGLVLRRQEIATRLRPVLDHVRRHFAERLPLAEAAAMCGLSPGRFGRVFKEACGMPLVAYIHQVRLARALELLEHSAEPISVIASTLGFSDQSHFDRRFRRLFGRTPSEVRNGIRGNRPALPRRPGDPPGA